MAWAPDYASDAELSAFVRIADDVDDAQIALAITAASRSVDHHCNRQFGKVDAAVARTYTARYRRERGRWVVTVDDLMSVTGLVVTVEDGAVDLHDLEPRNAAADGMPWTRLVIDPDAAFQPGSGDEYAVSVTAPWGWTSTPTPVKQATLLQASRLLSRRDAPFGIAGSPDAGSEMRLLARLDPDVAVSLRPYVRPRVPR